MKKLVRTSLVNTPNRRGIKDLNIQFYSHDKNNAGFEFVIKNETDLSEYTAKVLFHFVLSDSTWESAGTIEGNVVKATFNTDLIARCEEVLGFLFLDSESNSLDVFKFKFNVVLSEIDKNEVEKRKIKHVADIEALELVTRSELRDELSKIQVTGGVDLSGYLTTIVAEATYAKKSEIPTPYNDSALVQKIGQLEARVDNDTVYDDTNIKERLINLENKPSVDTSNFVTNTTLEEKHYVTNEQVSSTYATKSEIPQPYSDIELVKRITVLENRQDNDTVYDDAELKRRVTALEEKPSADTSNFVTTALLEPYAKKSELPAPYNDSALVSRVSALENKQDKDTVYDDTKVKERLTALESKPTVDTSNFLTKSELNTLRPLPTLSINNNTLSIAGGNSVLLPSNKPLTGNGTPEGNVIANPGDTYINNSVTLGDYYYYKERNPGKNTGWKVLYGSMGVNINLTTGGRIRFARENYFVNVSITDLTISLEALNSGQGRDFYQEGENVVIRFIPTKKFDARESIIPQGFRPSGNFLVPAYNKSGDSIGLFKFEQTYGVVKLILNDITTSNVTSEMLKGINSGLIVYPTQEAWMTKLP